MKLLRQYFKQTAIGTMAILLAVFAVSSLDQPVLAAAAPTVTSVSSTSGSTAGGDTVTITGTYFLAGDTVTFDGVDALNVTVVNATTITATTPAGVAGTSDIRITHTTGETGMLAGGFIYVDATHTINTWTGATSVDWATATNWSKGTVPSADDIVAINSAPRFPALTMTSAMTFYSMQIGTTSSVIVTIVNGSEVNLLSFTNDLAIGPSGTLTHDLNTTLQTNRLFIQSSANVSISGRINLTAKGYSTKNGPGGGSAAAHAGLANGNTKAPYGSIRQPVDLGSGGANGAGGGSVKITAFNVTIDGSVTADAGSTGSGGSVWINATNLMGKGTITANAVTNYSSAGRIAIYADNNTYTGVVQAKTIIGAAGTIYKKIGSQANGDLTIDNGGADSGMFCAQEMDSAVTYDNLRATGGGGYCIPSGYETKVVGTLQDAGAAQASLNGKLQLNGRLTVYDSTTLTNYFVYLYNPDGYSDQNPIVGSGSSFEVGFTNTTPGGAAWRINSLTVLSGGVVTHTANTTTQSYALNIDAATSINIQTGGRIDVARKGYSASNGPGSGMYAVHAGYTYNNAKTPYGSIRQPVDLGSGGSTGTGGGAVKLTAPMITVDGIITADGTQNSTAGSVWLNATTRLGGGGSINASAVSSYVSPGRIAIYAASSTFTGSMNAKASGLTTAGTIFTKIGNQPNGDLLIDNVTVSSTNYCTPEMDTNSTYDNIQVTRQGRYCIPSGTEVTTGSFKPAAGTTSYAGIIENLGTIHTNGSHLVNYIVYQKGVYDDPDPIIGSGTTFEDSTTNPTTPWNVQTLTVKSGGTLTTPANVATHTYSTNVHATGTISVESGGVISTDNKGYSGGNGPGAGTATNAGGGYGGQGLPIGAGGGTTYGDQYQPTDLGSSGGGASGVAGGGAIKLTSGGTIQINGTITANGAKGISAAQGGGSGGSVWLTAGSFTGTGKVTVKGGDSYSGTTYAGGGGRIALTYSAALSLTAVTPNKGGTAGGDSITLSGNGFNTSPTITFGANTVTTQNYINSTTLNVTAPAAASTGPVDVTISQPAFGGTLLAGAGTGSTEAGTIEAAQGTQTATLANAYTYLASPPTISSISSANGPATGGNSVTITGSQYQPDTKVFFGNNEATVAYVDSTHLTATVPAGTGVVDVRVLNADTQEAVLTAAYTYNQAPTIVSVVPGAGAVAGGNNVTISGANFLPGTTVKFGARAATNVTIVNSTTITATVPTSASAQVVDVIVTLPDGQTATLTKAYSYNAAPVIGSITPNSGPVAGGNQVTIAGVNFLATPSVEFDGQPATNVTFVSSSQITATVPAHVAGSVNITLTNPDGQTTTRSNAYTYQGDATIAGLSISQGPMAGSTLVTVTGTNFDSTTKVFFDGTEATVTSRTGTTDITVRTPSHAPADVDVRLQTNVNTTTLTNAYRYMPDTYAFTSAPSLLHTTETGQLTIQARSSSKIAVVVPYDLTLSLSSTSTGGMFSTDNITWGASSVVIPAGQSSITIYYKDINPGTPTLTSTSPDDVKATQDLTIISQYLLLVTGVTDPIKASVPSSVTVQATDWQGNIVSDYTGTVHFSSSDPFATIPVDFTITPEMNGRYTFVNGVSMLTAGEQCVTVTDSSYGEITGSLCDITVEQGYAGSPAKFEVVTDPQTAPVNTPTQPITLQIQNDNSEPVAAPNDLTVYIGVNSSTGKLSVDGTSWQASGQISAVIKKGTSSINIYYQDSAAGTRTLTFKDQTGTTDAGLTDTSQQVAIGVGAPITFGIEIAASLPAASWRAFTVTMRDQYNQVATNRSSSAINFTLSSTGTGVEFSARSDGSSPTATFNGSFATGSSTRTIYVKSPTSQAVTLTVTDPNAVLTKASADVSFTASVPTNLSISSSATMRAGDIIPVTISMTDGNGLPASNTTDTTVSFAMKTGSVGEFSLQSTPFSSIASAVIPKDTTSVTIYFRSNTANTQTIEVRANLASGATAASQSIVVSPADFAAYSLAGSPGTAPVNEATELYLQTTDIYGNIMPVTAAADAYVSSSSASGSFAAATGDPWDVSRVTIPAGSSTTPLFYRDTSFGAKPTLTASDTTPVDSPDTGIVNAVHTMSIVGQAIGGVRFTSPTQTIKAGEASSAITIRAEKSDGSAAIVGQDTSVYVTSTSENNAKFLATADPNAPSIAKVTIPAGQSEATVYYTDTRAGTVTLTASIGGFDARQSITIQSNDASKYIATSPIQTITQNDPSAPIAIQLTDAYENPVTSTTNDMITLSSTCTTGTFATTTNPWQPVTELNYPANNSGGITVYFKSSEKGDCMLTFASGTYSAGTQLMHIAQGAFKLAVIVTDPLVTGETTALRVELQDEVGNIATRIETTQVWLSSTAGSLAQSTLTIPAGASSAEVSMTAPLSTGSMTVSARDEQSGTDTVLVNASRDIRIEEGAVDSITYQPTSVSTSAGTPVAVTIAARNRANSPTTATTNIPLQLASTMSGYFTTNSDPAAPAVTQATIVAGQNSVTLYYRQTSSGTATITASSSAYGNATGTVTVSPIQIKGYRYVTPKTNLEAGETGSYVIEAYDQYGNTAIMPAGYTMYVSSTGRGVIGGNSYNSTTHALTASSATDRLSFTYRSNEPETGSLVVSDIYPVDSPDSGVANAKLDVTVAWGAPVRLQSLSTSLGVLIRGDNGGPVTFQLMNAHDTVVPASVDTTATVTSSSSSGEFADSINSTWNRGQVQRTIKAGQTSLSLVYRDNAALGTFTISASSTGLQKGEASGTITAGEPTQIVFKSTPQTTYATHTSLPIILEAQNQFGQPTPFTQKRILQVDSSSSTGSYAQTPPTWDTYQIEWPAGAASIQYYYRDYQTGTHTLTAMMDALRIPNSTQTTSQAIAQPFTITPQVLDHFIVTNISSPQTTDNKTSVVIMAADAKDYVVAGYDGTVRFLTSDPEGTVPQPYTFVPYIDKGLHTFVNGVSFKTPGEHTVTVIDDVHGVLGAQTSILVLGAAIPGPIETGDNPSDTSSPQPASPTSPTTSKGNPSSDGDKTGSRTPSVDNGTSQTPGTDSHAADAAHDADSPITSFFTRVEGAFHGKTPLHIAGVIAVILVAVWSLIRELRHIAFLGAIKKRQQKLRAEAQAKQISLAFMRPIEGITPDAILRPWYLRLPVYVPVFISIILTIALLRTIDHSTAQATVLFIASLLTAMAYTALRYRWLNSVDRAADNELNNEESYLLAQTTLS